MIGEGCESVSFKSKKVRNLPERLDCLDQKRMDASLSPLLRLSSDTGRTLRQQEGVRREGLGLAPP